ncbi:cuticle protein 19-like isoform X2 [Tigriopus californicus]|uniref:cuticle protein 19-like isoform X2 n=1 Tax=Tigriopus californicus TaxID=6832 RepID=UPI0027DA85A2|nr:cuticle protein 19-like isoform X2 [Tigriopus californicus]
MNKIICFLGLLVAAASAIPAGPSYHQDPYKIPPRPFHYAYGVSDKYSGTNFDKKESQDEQGNVNGEYRVALPDGRTQIVSYHANHHDGFIADVKFEGYPQHPAPQKNSYKPKPYAF